MIAKVKLKTKAEILTNLLRDFGNGLIDHHRFWREMDREGFTQDSIDRWCEEYNTSQFSN